MKIIDVLILCNKYINNIKTHYNIKLWAKSPSFDINIINSWCNEYGIREIVKYNEESDVRTIINEYVRQGGDLDSIPKQTDTEHNALFDSIYQCIVIQYCWSYMDNKFKS